MSSATSPRMTPISGHRQHLDASKLTPYQHSPEDLADFIDANIRRLPAEMRWRQRSAYHKLRASYNKSTEHGLLTDPFSYFDDFFFSSSLAKHVNLVNRSTGDEMIHLRTPPNTAIDVTASLDGTGRKEVLQYWGYVLHHMIHAFLEIYGCIDCRKEQNEDGEYVYKHCLYWQKIAEMIQKAVRDPELRGVEVVLKDHKCDPVVL
jgi:hypothetical protein